MPASPTNVPAVEVRAEGEGDGRGLRVTFKGDWRLHGEPPEFAPVAAALDGAAKPARVAADTSEVTSGDSTLASFLTHLRQACEDREIAFDDSGLTGGQRSLLDLALAVPEKKDARSDTFETKFFYQVGTASIAFIGGFKDLLHFIGECVLSLGRFVLGRARFRSSDLWECIEDCGMRALPIVSLISFLVGMILAFVGNIQLANFGASIYVADMVAIAMVREMGAIMTGIIMSGRTGAAYAAQIGSMKVTQEIDALRTFGFNPVDFLVLPRMLALMIMMPLLTLYANAVGIFGGFLVSMMSDITATQYINQTINSLDLTNCMMGVGKSLFFGIVIAGAGCLRGMQSGNSSSAVGTAATSAVVTSITAIIVLDALFAVLFTILKI